MERDSIKGDEAKGFAGLSTLISDIDTAPPPPPSEIPGRSSTSHSTQLDPIANDSQHQPRSSQQPPADSGGTQPNWDGSSIKWVLVIAFFISGLWYYNSNNKPSANPTPDFSAAESYSSFDAVPGTTEMSSADQAFESHRLQEYRPTANQDFVFSRAQVRYCLAEEIRMEGARSAVNRYSDLDVERFNNMIADYNSRCGKFRYRSGVLEGARSDVEPYREELKAEGRSKFADKPFYNGSSNSTPTAPEPDVRLKRVQQPLEQPGNYGSVVDELDGPDTQPAIVDFQKGNALPETGKVDDDLVSPLDSTPVKPSNSWPNPAEELQSESPPLPSSTTSWVPANAVAWGSGWVCKVGFKQKGNSCIPTNMPANATAWGSSWVCNVGFRREGDTCVAAKTH